MLTNAGQPECAYYLRHGRCGFGPSCKFHHPESGKAGSASQEEPASTASVDFAAVDFAADTAIAPAPAGPETAASQADATSPSQPQESAQAQQTDHQPTPTSAQPPQPASVPPPNPHVPYLAPQAGPQLAIPLPQWIVTQDGAAQAPQLQLQPQQQTQPAVAAQRTAQVQLPAAAAAAGQPGQAQGQAVSSPSQASQPQSAMPAAAQLHTIGVIPALTQPAVFAHPAAETQHQGAPQPQLQPDPQVVTAWLPAAATLQPLQSPAAAPEQPAAAAATTGQVQATAPQTSAFLPIATVPLHPQQGLQPALPGGVQQQRHLPRRANSVPEGSLAAMQSSAPVLQQAAMPAPANLTPFGGVPMVPSVQPPQPLVTQLQPQTQFVAQIQPQAQQCVTQLQTQLQTQLPAQQLATQQHQQGVGVGVGPQAAQLVAGGRLLSASVYPNLLLAC